jgi:hypothetical protein
MQRGVGIDMTIIAWTQIKLDVKVWSGFNWLRIRCSEHGSEPSGSINVGEFLVQLSDCQLLEVNSSPWILFLKVIRNSR